MNGSLLYRHDILDGGTNSRTGFSDKPDVLFLEENSSFVSILLWTAQNCSA